MIHSLRHFALTVPDLEPGIEFYEAFGLNRTDRAPGFVVGFRCDGRDHDEVILVKAGDRRQLHHLSFGADAGGMGAIETRLRHAGTEFLDKPASDAPDGLWFRDPEGVLVNITAAARYPDHDPGSYHEANRPGVLRRKDARGCPAFDTNARPRKLGHMIVFAKDVMAKVRFYTDVLGLKVSDIIEGGYAAFLHAPGDSDHHIIGILHAEGPGFHHASFEMDSVDHMAIGARRLLAANGRQAWGPGRHGVGSNYFHYFRDPWNGMAEYYCDMDFISADKEWEAHDWTKKDGMFLWSADGMPPSDFGKNYELADNEEAKAA